MNTGQAWVRLPLSLLSKKLPLSAVILAALLLDREDEEHGVIERRSRDCETLGITKRRYEQLIQELWDARVIEQKIWDDDRHVLIFYLRGDILPPKQRKRSSPSKYHARPKSSYSAKKFP